MPYLEIMSQIDLKATQLASNNFSLTYLHKSMSGDAPSGLVCGSDTPAP